jgi:hypothetical protein
MKKQILKNWFGYTLALWGICAVIIQFNITTGLPIKALQQHFLFYINYAGTLLYLLFLLIDTFRGKLKWNYFSIHTTIVMTLLLTNFILFNGNFLITSRFTRWLHYFFILNAIAILLIPFAKQFPKYIRIMHLFFMGFVLQLSLYFVAFLFPTFIGLVASSFLLGLSILGFVPLLLLIYSIQFFKINRQKHAYEILTISFIATTILVANYTFQWYKTDRQIATIETLKLEEKIPVNSVSEKIIMGGFVYDNFNQYWTGQGNRGSELKKHNPLIAIALLVSSKTNFNHAERIYILNQFFKNFDGAHQNIWMATIFKANTILIEPTEPNNQQWLIIFLFPALFILTFYRINQYDF